MRNYQSYLLLEDLFDYLPEPASSLYQFADSVFNPSVEVTEIDCGTTLGKITDITFGLVGYIELSTNDAITSSRVSYLLSQGTYKIALRNLHSCTAEGGVCQECYKGSFPYKSIPQINSVIKIPSEYTFSEDVFISDGVLLPSYELSIPEDSYSDIIVYVGDSLLDPIHYSITNNIITLDYIPDSGLHIVIKYITKSAKPFLSYLAKSYSGSLLGMKSLPTAPIVIRESLLKSMLSSTQLNTISSELERYKSIPESHLGFLDSIHDRLEKALFMIALFGIYSNVTV